MSTTITAVQSEHVSHCFLGLAPVAGCPTCAGFVTPRDGLDALYEVALYEVNVITRVGRADVWRMLVPHYTDHHRIGHGQPHRWRLRVALPSAGAGCQFGQGPPGAGFALWTPPQLGQFLDECDDGVEDALAAFSGFSPACEAFSAALCLDADTIDATVRAAPGLHGVERMATLETECERLVGLGATRSRRDEPAPRLLPARATS